MAEYYSGDIDSGEVRCEECQKLLARRLLNGAIFEVKCSRCGKLNRILDGAADLVLVTDADAKILYANRRLFDMTGYTEEEVIGKTPRIWGANMPEEFYKDFLHRMKDERGAVSVIVNNKRKDGAPYRASLRVSPVLDGNGDVKLFIATQSIIP